MSCNEKVDYSVIPSLDTNIIHKRSKFSSILAIGVIFLYVFVSNWSRGKAYDTLFGCLQENGDLLFSAVMRNEVALLS